MSNVLWVDDDVFLKKRIAPSLEDEGLTVFTADDAENAVSVFNEHFDDIDLVILDVMMPGGEGFDEATTKGGFETGVALARWIHKQNPNLPLIGFSLSTDKEVTGWFLKHGAAFVEKTYDGANLISSVKEALNATKQNLEDDTKVSGTATASAVRPLGVGERIGRYEIRGVLGRGGMGEVFLAWDEQLQREVAIKSPRRDRFATERDYQQFLEEARTVAKLKHANIVDIYDILLDRDGMPVIIMEYVDGRTLREILDTEKLTYEQIREMIISIAGSLDFAHHAGFVHRDIKPANILLNKMGQPKIADFGLAIRLDVTQIHEQIAGSLAYMAPEQLRGQSLDSRADIWALGVVLYEMLVGRRPFGSDNLNAALDEILNRDPEPPRTLDANVPEDLDGACRKCLQKDPGARFEKASDIRHELFHAGSSHILDMHHALLSVNGDTDLLTLVLEDIVRELPTTMLRLRDSLHENEPDCPVGSRLSHTLRGALGSLGARRASECAARMEDLCSRKGFDAEAFAAARALLPELEHEVELACHEIKVVLARLRPET